MQVMRFGENLGVCLPDAVVNALRLKEGDEIELQIKGKDEIEISNLDREAALSRLRSLRRPFPSDFKFDRIEANER